jgi:hypothetical protein
MNITRRPRDSLSGRGNRERDRRLLSRPQLPSPQQKEQDDFRQNHYQYDNSETGRLSRALQPVTLPTRASERIDAMTTAVLVGRTTTDASTIQSFAGIADTIATGQVGGLSGIRIVTTSATIFDRRTSTDARTICRMGRRARDRIVTSPGTIENPTASVNSITTGVTTTVARAFDSDGHSCPLDCHDRSGDVDTHGLASRCGSLKSHVATTNRTVRSGIDGEGW